jgi:hypothetical protein
VKGKREVIAWRTSSAGQPKPCARQTGGNVFLASKDELSPSINHPVHPVNPVSIEFKSTSRQFTE